MRGQYLIGQLHWERTHLGDAQEAYHRAVEAARAAGRPWAPYGFDARLMEAIVAYVRGSWDETLQICDLSGQSPPSDPEALMVSVRMMVAAGRGDPEAPGAARPGASRLAARGPDRDQQRHGGDRPPR